MNSNSKFMCRDEIIRLFNRRMRPKGKYTCIDRNERAVIKFCESKETFTCLSERDLWGEIHGDETNFDLSNGNFKYLIVDEHGKEISDKRKISDAQNIIINGKYLFWIPSDAVLPFCFLLNFFSSQDKLYKKSDS